MDIYQKLKSIKEKFDKINEELSDPNIISDQAKYIALSKERTQLSEIVTVFNEYDTVLKNIEGNKEIIDTSDDKELTEIAETELVELKEKVLELEDKIKFLLLTWDK